MGADPLEGAANPLSPAVPTVRAFVGVGLPDPHRETLAGYLVRCAELAPAFRSVAPANLHLTLRFLGNQEPERLELVAARLRAVAIAPFPLQLEEPGTFGRGSAVRVLWLGAGGDGGRLAALAAEVEVCCQEAGLEPEPRPYRPHLTLARSRARAGSLLPELPPPPDLPTWAVTGFELYRSRPAPGGAVYSVIERFGP